jgi:hypothetical protein
MTDKQRCRIDWNRIPWTAPMPGVRVKVVEQEGQKLRLAEFSRAFEEVDWCRKGHIGYVLEGEGELQFHDHTIRLCAGNGLWIPPGEEHRHRLQVLSERLCVILVEQG